MRFRLIFALVATLFLFAAYFFVSHAYVLVRLTTVLGFLAFGSMILILVLIAAGKRLL